jgi:hypothetical protein
LAIIEARQAVSIDTSVPLSSSIPVWHELQIPEVANQAFDTDASGKPG